MRTADYIIDYLYRHGVKVIFMGAGGGMMFLSDAIKRHKKIKYICFHHEQAAGYAAVGYAKYTNTPAVCIVTTGCGGTNVMTPLLVAYQDYVPLIVIQGDTKSIWKDTDKRLYGIQGFDIKSTVSGLARFIEYKDKKDVEEALDCCKQKPVWLSVPLDTQEEKS